MLYYNRFKEDTDHECAMATLNKLLFFKMLEEAHLTKIELYINLSQKTGLSLKESKKMVWKQATKFKANTFLNWELESIVNFCMGE